METITRLLFAIGIFLLMVCLEYVKPRRILSIGRKPRWLINLGLAALNMVIMRFSIGALAYLTAITAQKQGLGLLNLLNLPVWLNILIALLFLDVAIYAQHVLAHKWSLLWRLHQVHHTDIDIDATTAVRFHPLEIMLSMLYKMICVFIIGANPTAVVIFEVILNAAATFNHSNVYIPSALEQKLRYFLVTPDMHRIHHSVVPKETDSNYGFSISCWDRLFKTYIAEPQSPQTQMAIGLAGFRHAQELSFFQLLLLPFQKMKAR
jgi:sterol desaturase/sphingolipid hydroxylase (fatty acid hydroxylase superfamily)